MNRVTGLLTTGERVLLWRSGVVGAFVIVSTFFACPWGHAREEGQTSATEGEIIPFTDGSATLVVLPDTEVYANKRPQFLKSMFEWIAGNVEKRSIKSVLHVGDMTNSNTDREWKNLRKYYDLIEGRAPYVVAAVNHDYDGTVGRLTFMNKYFRAEDQKRWPGFGDVFEEGKLENHYQFVGIHGRKWIVLSLEMGPRKAVVEWADQVLAKHKDSPALILTHAYMYYGNTRYDCPVLRLWGEISVRFPGCRREGYVPGSRLSVRH